MTANVFVRGEASKSRRELPACDSCAHAASFVYLSLGNPDGCLVGVGLCEPNSTGQSCQVTVSILDTLTYVATSVLWMLAYIVAQHLPVLIINTGIFPLSAFRVEILLAYVEEQTKTSVSSFN